MQSLDSFVSHCTVFIVSHWYCVYCLTLYCVYCLTLYSVYCLTLYCVYCLLSHTVLCLLSHTVLCSLPHTVLCLLSHTVLCLLSHTVLCVLSYTVSVLCVSHRLTCNTVYFQLMVKNPENIPFLFKVYDLGCQLEIPVLRDSVRSLLRLLPAGKTCVSVQVC